ncbi:hypothetical protein D3C77_537310 [compost metagenome]
MQQSYLVEVSAKYSEGDDFHQLLSPTFVSEKELQGMLDEYHLHDGQSVTLNGMSSFYSKEKHYPFNRLLVLSTESRNGLSAPIDTLQVNLCSFVRFKPTPTGEAHDLIAKS